MQVGSPDRTTSVRSTTKAARDPEKRQPSRSQKWGQGWKVLRLEGSEQQTGASTNTVIFV